MLSAIVFYPVPYASSISMSEVLSVFLYVYAYVILVACDSVTLYSKQNIEFARDTVKLY